MYIVWQAPTAVDCWLKEILHFLFHVFIIHDHYMERDRLWILDVEYSTTAKVDVINGLNDFVMSECKYKIHDYNCIVFG